MWTHEISTAALNGCLPPSGRGGRFSELRGEFGLNGRLLERNCKGVAGASPFMHRKGGAELAGEAADQGDADAVAWTRLGLRPARWYPDPVILDDQVCKIGVGRQSDADLAFPTAGKRVFDGVADRLGHD